MTKNDQQQKNKFANNKSPFFGVVIFVSFIVISLVVAYGIYQPSHKNVPNHIAVNPRFNEDRATAADDQLLRAKDYSSYQDSLYFYANNYFSRKDYTNTEKVLMRIISNVPPGQIQDETYVYLNQLYMATKDKPKYKEYTKLLIENLKKEGKSQNAAAYEKQLKENE